jgi:hypothetical protein
MIATKIDFKKFIIAVIAIVFITMSANALTITFSDKDFLGGVSWGTMEITATSSNTLKVRYDAAASSMIPVGSQVTGFGFTFKPVTLIPTSITNSSSGMTLNWIKLTNLNAIPNPSNGDEFTPPITKFDYFYGATEGNANNINPPGITPGNFDIFSLTFTGAPDLTALDLASFVQFTGIRLQGLPNNINGGSLFLAGKEPSAPVPEPATLILIGSGLLGLAGFRKKIKN